MVILALILAAVCLAGAGACAVLANHAVVSAYPDAIRREAEAVPGRPVAIVFGARAWGDAPSLVLRDRLDAGIRLYRMGKVEKLLMSGDHGQTEYDEVAAMRAYALEQGVPAEDVFLDHAGFRTYATLYRARDVFGVRSAILVTQAFHLPRAVYTARRLGIDAVGLVADAHRYRSRGHNRRREFLARLLAWLQVNVTRPEPRYLGPPIDISGDGRVTHDS
ncbi:MAG: ElyC/SanA/YdcF family protein [Planctomycetota bacterium]